MILGRILFLFLLSFDKGTCIFVLSFLAVFPFISKPRRRRVLRYDGSRAANLLHSTATLHALYNDS